VTIERTTHQLPDPFFVIATQNPLTAAGTYPLPENQLDRFLLCLHIGYLDAEHEIEVVAREDGHRFADDIRPVAKREALLEARRQVDGIRCARELVAFMVELANRTRSHAEIVQGVSTRGAQALHRACRARALVHGRAFVVPDDVRALLLPTWGHRISTRNGDTEAQLHAILAGTPLPE
jgi:MoxR-like ATPase